MSEYTSTREGFQRAMQWSLDGPPEEATKYAEATVLPTFYHTMNDRKLDYKTYVDGIAEWRGKTTDYAPVVHEFLREGDQLAARMTGTIKVESTDMKFESFMFGTIDLASGKFEHLIERSVWGPVGAAPVHGVQ